MPSSHRRQGQQDCLVLSCFCQRCALNWRPVKTVLTCLEMRCELCFVLSETGSTPSLLFATVQSQIYWGLLKTVLSRLQFSSHCRHGQDKTGPCWHCELGITVDSSRQRCWEQGMSDLAVASCSHCSVYIRLCVVLSVFDFSWSANECEQHQGTCGDHQWVSAEVPSTLGTEQL